jgi:hypothetical protein
MSVRQLLVNATNGLDSDGEKAASQSQTSQWGVPSEAAIHQYDIP